MDNRFSTLLVRDDVEHVLILRLNRPAVCNAINSVMMQELLGFWQQVPSCEGVRAVIVTGEGNRAFCAGADLKERKDITIETWQQQHAVLQQAMRAMIQCPVPVIAAVNGVAYGGGLELTLASDFAYACESAVFAQSEVKLGIMPGAMGTQNLSRAVGLRRAKELSFTGETFTAAQAVEWGVVNRVFSADALLPRAIETASRIASNAPLALRRVKSSIDHSWSNDVMAGYLYEMEHYNQLLSTQDRVEGINAFNEKRLANFKGK